uniref:NADH-ubiquinone oxidoreductase chain 2 n=1 Tax=Monodontina vondembuschiana TaxID=2508272 RepID=A0A513X0F3_9BIVA|nr:NADH dehydrogenase subunit 2 [Monodontina vondembuschiana]QDH07411.1 NADH dehydrogenase subunit 2 [Monodontina vondembuschiana]
MKSPHKFLFLFLMISSTCMVISSSNWLTTWMGLEINMLGFIPLMYLKETPNESETAVKYLIPQSLGSTIFIVSALTSSYLAELQPMMSMAMCLKLGAAPFHYWFPSVMAGLPLLPAFILLTWQKIAPIFAINSTSPDISNSTMLIASISALWGGIGGLNQTDIRSLLTYSSIAHTGWMLAAINSNSPTLAIYVTAYILINTSIYVSLTSTAMKMHKQLFSAKSPHNSLLLATSILSLGGLPPLTGFVMKLLVINFTQASMLIILTLILGALISLFFYLSVTFSPLLELGKLHTIKLDSSKPLVVFSLAQILPLSMILLFF